MFQNLVFYIKTKTWRNVEKNYVCGEYYTIAMPGTQVVGVKKEENQKIYG